MFATHMSPSETAFTPRIPRKSSVSSKRMFTTNGQTLPYASLLYNSPPNGTMTYAVRVCPHGGLSCSVIIGFLY
jgi:hypothetical protein